MRELVPWWVRIAGKLVLSRVPVSYDTWRGLGVFRHGEMHHPAYALSTFQSHFTRARIPVGAPFVALEIGPGDSLASAVIAAACGATRVHLVDTGSFATADLGTYRELCAYLRQAGLQPPDLESTHDTATLLQRCRAVYATRGVESLREIPAGSVDFIWSNAVLEHVRRAAFGDLVRETRRVARRGSLSSHQVDLQDHLGGALNNLRIGSRWWEAEWMARSGFYTNRLRMSDMVRAFEGAGFAIEALACERWEVLPTSRRAFAPEFARYEVADLLVKSFTVSLQAA
ncbi:MAG TPA: class I SAM-dependent methyltransferase [Steroidobacteraceae bacterium]|nr:class I SAM-dependent methyltransferase [Steroidobacteraceae bacterium]